MSQSHPTLLSCNHWSYWRAGEDGCEACLRGLLPADPMRVGALAARPQHSALQAAPVAARSPALAITPAPLPAAASAAIPAPASAPSAASSEPPPAERRPPQRRARQRRAPSAPPASQLSLLGLVSDGQAA